jgi:hypothetical protein
MPIEQKQDYCAACGTNTLFQRSTPHHLIHVLVTVFSCGLWLIPWMIFAWVHDSAYRCQTCGGEPGTPAQKKARIAQAAAIDAIFIGILLTILIFISVYVAVNWEKVSTTFFQ